MNGLAIREATPEDVAAILGLYREAGIGAGVEFTVAEGVAQLEMLRSYPSYRVFVAVLDGRVVGTYELLVMDNLAKRGLKSGVVEDVAVAPPQQGQGIGRAMMQHAAEISRADGCYKITLSSNRRREDAHRFYESLGFAQHGYSFLLNLEAKI